MNAAPHSPERIKQLANNGPLRSHVVRQIEKRPESIALFDERAPGLVDAMGIDREKVEALRLRKMRAAGIASTEAAPAPIAIDWPAILAAAPTGRGVKAWLTERGIDHAAFFERRNALQGARA